MDSESDWYGSDDEEYYDSLNSETFGETSEDCTWNYPSIHDLEVFRGISRDHGRTSRNTQDGDVEFLNTSWVDRIVDLVVEDDEKNKDGKCTNSSGNYKGNKVISNFSATSLLPSQVTTRLSLLNSSNKQTSGINLLLGPSIWTVPPPPASPPQNARVTAVMNTPTLSNMHQEIITSKKSTSLSPLNDQQQNEAFNRQSNARPKPKMLTLEDVEREIFKESILREQAPQLQRDEHALPLPLPHHLGMLPRTAAPQHWPLYPQTAGRGIYVMSSNYFVSPAHPPPPYRRVGPMIDPAILHRHMPPSHRPPFPYIPCVPAPQIQQYFREKTIPATLPFESGRLPDVVTTAASGNVSIKNPRLNRMLLTKRDKRKLNNIQIIQLQSDHPFTTDYYNLMLKAKQAHPSSGWEFQLNFLAKLYKDTPKDTRKYEPVIFENCLGKLHAVSSLAPRRVIDTFIRLPEAQSLPKNTSYFRQRHLLLGIEKLFQCLLFMEEFQIRVHLNNNAMGEEVSQSIVQKWVESETEMVKMLSNRHRLCRVLSIRKGKMLVCRALSLLEPAVRYPVLGHLLSFLPAWSGDPDCQFKALPHLKRCIFNATEICHLRTIILCGEPITKEQDIFQSLITSPLGITLLMAIFAQAEKLLTILADSDSTTLQETEILWTRVSMAGFLIILERGDQISSPMEVYPNIFHHLHRFPFFDHDIRGIQTILQRWRFC